jgi:hypothetical protein
LISDHCATNDLEKRAPRRTEDLCLNVVIHIGFSPSAAQRIYRLIVISVIFAQTPAVGGDNPRCMAVCRYGWPGNVGN